VSTRRLVAALAALSLSATALARTPPRRAGKESRHPASARIVAHPDQLQAPPLEYVAPDRASHRHVLSGGVVTYVVPDAQLPLVNVVVTARGGRYLDPPGKEGLADAVADQMRDGGAGERDAATFDDDVAFLAVNLSLAAEARECSATMNVLAKDLDGGLDLLFDALRRPRFQPDRLALYRTEVEQGLRRRNDDTTTIEMREWRRLHYGADHFDARQTTTTSLAAITRDDMVELHRRLWHPGNLIVAVSGDVAPADILARLERRFAGWEAGPPSPPAPKPVARGTRDVLCVNKDDVNQTRVSFGHASTTWDDPNAVGLEVMMEILGGGGFTSRIVKTVRSDEGLAYSASAVMGFGRDYPQTLRVAFQSKNRSVARGIDLALAEVARMQQELVTPEELETAKRGFIETFPRRFASAQARASQFVQDELWGRPATWWKDYRGKVAAVTREDVQRVAREYLHAERMTFLVVGKLSEVLAGDPDHPENVLSHHAGPRGLLEIPLPDPGTLVYPHEPTVIVTPAGAPATGAAPSTAR
jgi:zinc protease